MNRETYNYIWETAVCPSIQDIKKSLDQQYGATDNYGLTILDLETHKENIYQSYSITRDRLKKQFFRLDSNKLMDDNLIDIHKIAACFCKSILDNKIFVFEMKEETPVKVMLCNYALAFSASIGIMYLNLLGIYKEEQEKTKRDHLEEQKKSKYDYLKEQKKFVFPPTNEGHDTYFMGRVKTLALNDIYGISFDLLTNSDMMFWIEDYNKKVIESSA